MERHAAMLSNTVVFSVYGKKNAGLLKSHLYSYYKLDVAEVWWHLLHREVSILVHGQKRLEELARLKGDLCVLVRPNYELKCRVPHLIWRVLDKQEDVGAKIRVRCTQISITGLLSACYTSGGGCTVCCLCHYAPEIPKLS